MIGALLYLRLTSLFNLVVYKLRRLRQPRYLIGTAVALAYIYFILMPRTMVGGRAAALPAAAGAGAAGMAVICVGMSALAVLRILYAWMAPADKPGLRFSEAEIAFLFPAPVSRRTLIHFRLLSAQIAILFTSALMALFFNRFADLGGSRVLRAVGWWVILSTFDLHLTGTNLMLARLRERGAGFLFWRGTGIAAIIAYVAALLLSVAAYARAYPSVDFLSGFGAPHGFHQGLLASQPFRWLILPFRIVFGPYLAVGWRPFGLALGPALILLGLHYYWVLSSEAPFEEGSIALAEKRAAAKAAAQSGDFSKIGRAKPKARPGPFPLAPTGPPEIAFLWKNLLSMRSTLVNRRTLFVTAWLVLCLSFGLRPLLAHPSSGGGFAVFGPILVVFCGIVAVYTLLLGPQLVRQDLRSDLANADILKTYPIEGWRLALGELLAPTAVLTLSLWLSILVCTLAIDPGGAIAWLSPGLRLTCALCLGAVAPLVCLIQLIVPNSIMLLMPGWYQGTRTRGGGIELLGQRLIFGFAQLLMALIVAGPAVLAAVLVIFSAQFFVGLAGAIVVATVAVVTIFAGEAAVGLWWLGGRFERFDLSSELR
jgi:ABC-2 type transport system permease protein